MTNFLKRLNRNRKLRMKSFWHPGYEGTCYNGKQTAIDEILYRGLEPPTQAFLGERTAWEARGRGREIDVKGTG